MEDETYSEKTDTETETPEAKFPTDGVLIQAFGTSVTLGSADIAKRVADATNRKVSRPKLCGRKNSEALDDSYCDQTQNTSRFPKVGDFVRATYEDGVDYEAKIIFVNEIDETCVVRYIGYENEQEVRLSDLVPTWGKTARSLQYEQAKNETVNEEQLPREDKNKKRKGNNFYGGWYNRNDYVFDNIPQPPPPPMPPMMENISDIEENEQLAAMLMSWYMSGYYTGIYLGMRMQTAKSKRK